MIIEYCKDGVPISDFEVEDFVKKSWTEDRNIKTSSEIVITALRSLIKRKVIPYQNVVIIFKHYRIQIDSRGSLSDYPEGFCNTNVTLLMSLI